MSSASTISNNPIAMIGHAFWFVVMYIPNYLAANQHGWKQSSSMQTDTSISELDSGQPDSGTTFRLTQLLGQLRLNVRRAILHFCAIRKGLALLDARRLALRSLRTLCR